MCTDIESLSVVTVMVAKQPIPLILNYSWGIENTTEEPTDSLATDNANTCFEMMKIKNKNP